MDLFWSGLVRRASEHRRIERKSQFSKVFEKAIKDIETSGLHNKKLKMIT